MPGVELRTSACDGHAVVALRGELDVTAPADAEAAITALMALRRFLIIDMPALGFIVCSSLDGLLRAQELARRGSGDVVLAAPQPLVRRLLALTGNDEVFWVQSGVQAAVAGIARRRRRHSWRRLAVRPVRLRRATPSCTGAR